MADEPPLSSTVAVMQPTPEDGFEKITVLLPKDTVQKIDNMARIALLGSRGRTIQSLVDAVVDSGPDIGQILVHADHLRQVAANRRPGILPAIQVYQEQVATLNAVMFNVGQVLTRLNKFVGMRLVQPVSRPGRGGR
jgi:hypothetical protein